MMDMHIHIRDGLHDINELQKFIDIGKKRNIDTFVFLEHGNRVSKKHHGILEDYDTIDQIKKIIKKIKQKNPDIVIYDGIEIDYSDDIDFRNKTIDLINYGNFDYVLGGIHGIKFTDGKDYFKSIIDMLNNYKIDIIAHIKLMEDYRNYKELLKQIIILCSIKNVKVEINTSDRSRWNDDQLKFILNMLEEFEVPYTIGSDAHNSANVGYMISDTYKKIKMWRKMK